MRRLFPRGLSLLLLAVFGLVAKAKPADLDWPRAEAQAAEENARLEARPQGRGRALAVICTLYYTPREAGFTAERGFDLTPETRPGLGGRRYGRDFLRAVKTEGFGRLIQPVAGAAYLHYDGNGRYGFARRPTGRGGVPLVPRRSCAARGDPPGHAGEIPVGSVWLLDSPTLREMVSGTTHWKVADMGGALHRRHLDLYWGEDDPRGPGTDLARPRGTDFQWTVAIARRVDN